jgi:hypothetical protein
VCRSGSHEELQRANGEADNDDNQSDNDKEKVKHPRRVFRYTFMDPQDNNMTSPMFTFGFQELRSKDMSSVTAIRIWKHASVAILTTRPRQITIGISISEAFRNVSVYRFGTISTQSPSCGAS